MFNGTDPVLADDLRARLERVQARVREARADAVLVGGNVNLFYLAGRVFMGYVYVPAEGGALALVRRPAGLDGPNVAGLRKPEQLPERLAEAGLPLPRSLLLEGDELSHAEWERLAAVFPSAALGNGSGLLRRCRAVKTAYEARVMRQTGSRHAEVVSRFATVYEPGMTDQAWAIAMYGLMFQAGSLGLFRVAGGSMEAFMGTVLAGDNGGALSPYDFALGGAGLHPSLPVGQCGVVLREGMAVMADIAANFYGYLTDCSRTFAVGRLAPEALRAHEVSIAIQREIAAAGVPGARGEDLYALALRRAEEAGLADRFMGLGQKAKFVGHGTGIVINELPVLGARSQDVLEAGMCVALEPKFVIPGTGAVGVEDTFLVTDAGMQGLTPCDPALVVI